MFTGPKAKLVALNIEALRRGAGLRPVRGREYDYGSRHSNHQNQEP